MSGFVIAAAVLLALVIASDVAILGTVSTWLVGVFEVLSLARGRLDSLDERVAALETNRKWPAAAVASDPEPINSNAFFAEDTGEWNRN